MDQATDNANAPLFAQVQFYIVQSKELTPTVERDLAEVLKNNGAIEHCPSSNHANIPFRGLTHVISAMIDFEGYEKAEDAFIPVVNSGWVESSIAKKKLANPRSHSPDPRLYFSGLVVTTADLPEGDKDAIIGGTLAMGGLYSSAVTRTVTHIVALTMDPNPCQIAVAKNLKCKIVLPHWFDDCLRLGKRIDEAPYTLPNPEIMTKAITDRIPDTARPDLQGAISAHVGRLPTPAGSPTPERRDLNVFKDKTVMLARDLEIATHLRETVEDLMQSGGGAITTDVHRSDIYVCQYREGREYQTASWEGKVVGNLPWLFHLISHNSWTSPLRRLLHYPIVRGGLPGLKKVRISLSNYNGEARIYLENLAKAAGCEFTKTMKQDNTHLITAHMVSEKCEAAKEWNINIINHLWLEESYAKWQVQVLTNPRYTHFPPRTNLGEVVGQVPIDRQALERIFFPRTNEKGHDEPEEQEAPVPMRQADANVNKNRVSNSSAVQPPSSSHDALPVNRLKHSDAPTPKSLRKEAHRSSDGVPVKTPARVGADGKENETPSTTGSRSAKERAVAKLHNLAPDIALYEKEKKRVGGVVFGGRRKGDADRIDTSRKRSVSVASDESDADAEEEPKPVKRAKKGKGPPQMRLLTTGYAKWADNHRLEVEDKSRLRELGILITNDATSCTHLAAPKILRTQKFLCAVAHAPTILSTAFLDDCLARQKLLRPDHYLLADPEGETRLDVSLADIAARATANKGRLLQGQSIYCTEHVFGGFDSYKSIVEVNGGKCLLYRARAGSIPAKARRDGEGVEEDGHGDPEHVYLISGPKPEEKRLWGKFRSMVRAAGKVPRIVKTDWMLDLALRQEERWREEYDMAATEGAEGEA